MRVIYGKSMKKIFISLILITSFISLSLYSIKWVSLSNNDPDSDTQEIEDLRNHPIYKDYHFSQDNTVLDIGIQPLWVPTSIISEVMKRDNILREEMTSLGYSLNFYPFLKGNDVNFFMRSGDLEIGMGGDMPTLSLAASYDIEIVSIILSLAFPHFTHICFGQVAFKGFSTSAGGKQAKCASG